MDFVILLGLLECHALPRRTQQKSTAPPAAHPLGKHANLGPPIRSPSITKRLQPACRNPTFLRPPQTHKNAPFASRSLDRPRFCRPAALRLSAHARQPSDTTPLAPLPQIFAPSLPPSQPLENQFLPFRNHVFSLNISRPANPPRTDSPLQAARISSLSPALQKELPHGPSQRLARSRSPSF